MKVVLFLLKKGRNDMTGVWQNFHVNRLHAVTTFFFFPLILLQIFKLYQVLWKFSFNVTYPKSQSWLQ